MIDGEGVLGDLNKDVRTKAVENHYKWIDAAATLGCPMIRVNVEGEGDPSEVSKAAIESLNALIDYWKKIKHRCDRGKSCRHFVQWCMAC
jgi:hypothetical protein